MKTVEKLEVSPGKSLLLGMVIIFFTPLALLLLVLTIIGIPIAVLAIFTYVLAFFVSRIFTAEFIGSRLTKNLLPQYQNSRMTQFVLGMILLWLALKVPVLGFVVWILVLFIGFGGLALALLPAKKASASGKK